MGVINSRVIFLMDIDFTALYICLFAISFPSSSICVKTAHKLGERPEKSSCFRWLTALQPSCLLPVSKRCLRVRFSPLLQPLLWRQPGEQGCLITCVWHFQTRDENCQQICRGRGKLHIPKDPKKRHSKTEHFLSTVKCYF